MFMPATVLSMKGRVENIHFILSIMAFRKSNLQLRNDICSGKQVTIGVIPRRFLRSPTIWG